MVRVREVNVEEKWSVYQDHMRYVHNDIVKPFKVRILRYANHMRKMIDLANYPPPPSMEGKRSKAANWNVRNQDFTSGEVQLAIKDGLPKSMQDELDNHPEDYRFYTYEYWCDLLYKIEVKDERKMAAAQIKKIASDRAASIYESDESVWIPRKKKARTAVLRSNRTQKMRTITTVHSAIVCFARRQ